MLIAEVNIADNSNSTLVPALSAAALGHANPKIKEETLNWLKEAVQSEKKDSLGKLAQALLPAAAKCAEEATPSLREAALAFFVGFTIKVGISYERAAFIDVCAPIFRFQRMYGSHLKLQYSGHTV